MKRILPLLFSFHGRITRAEFLVGLTGAADVMILLKIASYLLLGETLAGSIVFAGIVGWSFSALCTKRLHDLGVPAWPVPLVILPMAAAIAAHMPHVADGLSGPALVALSFVAEFSPKAALIGVPFLTVVCLTAPGREGDNAYGPSPREA